MTKCRGWFKGFVDLISDQIVIFITVHFTFYQKQYFGSVGSEKFWLPGSGSAKICGFTDPDPRCKISTKNSKKNFFTPKTQFWTFVKREIIKISSFLNGSSSFRLKLSEKNKTKILKNQQVLKKWPGSGSGFESEFIFSSADPGSGSVSKFNGSEALLIRLNIVGFQFVWFIR